MIMNVDKPLLNQAHPIHVAFNASTLESLIRAGKLHAADFNCLDQSSQKGVWAMIRSIAVSTIRMS